MGNKKSREIDKLEVLEFEMFYEVTKSKRLVSNDQQYQWVICIYSNNEDKRLTKYIMKNVQINYVRDKEVDIDYYEYNKCYKKVRNRGYCKLIFIRDYVNLVEIELELKRDNLYNIYKL